MIWLYYSQLEADKNKVPGMVKETDHDDTEDTSVSPLRVMGKSSFMCMSTRIQGKDMTP